MKALFCIDDNGGMTFNNRRVSRDAALTERIFEIIGDEPLYITAFSEKLLSEYSDRTKIISNFNDIGDGFAFIESGVLPIENCDILYIFKWNRSYPADEFFDKNPSDYGFSLISAEDFVGKSHEKITLEIYKRS